jgi:hypothetical protein
MGNGLRSKRHVGLVETLEARQLLSAAQLNFPNFASTAGLVTNGYGGGATTSGNALVLTDGMITEERSVLSAAKVGIDTFTSHFSFQSNADPNSADGFTFVLDNGTNSDLGDGGSDLGYSAGTFGTNSVALAFNLYNNSSYGSTFGFASGGMRASSPVAPSSLDFHSGDTFDATVTYDGTTLSVSVVDTTTSQTFSDSETINLPQVLGGNAAYVGFTAGTGSEDSDQEIKSFDFTGTAPPTVTVAAASSPTTVTTTKGHLSVTAVSNTGGTLTYTWSILHTPPGAPTPTIKPNGSSSADPVTAHFFKDGTYRFRVTITDSNGGTTVSDVSVVVQQTATTIKLKPHKASIVKGTTEQFKATVVDQFGHVFRTEPTITYAVTIGGGSIDSSTGLYTASGSIGHLVITATADELTGFAGEVVIS